MSSLRDSREIAEHINTAFDESLAEVDLTPEIIAGSEWVSSISPPSALGVKPGDTASFDVALIGQRQSVWDDRHYEVNLWVRGDGSAVMTRVIIPIGAGD